MSASIEKILEAHTRQDNENFGNLEERLIRMEGAIEALKLQAAKDRSFIGGVVFIVSAFVGFVSIFGQQVLVWLRG